MTTLRWMSWEGGVDLVAATMPGLLLPNVLLHVARMVHTPVGSGPAGVVLWQPDPKAPPSVFGFVAATKELAAWFGPNIFAGTPFEQAPALVAKIDVTTSLPEKVASRIEVAGHVFEVTMSALGAGELVHRPAGKPMPFAQQGIEVRAAKTELRHDGKPVPITVPPTALGGGPGACFAPAGIYAR